MPWPPQSMGQAANSTSALLRFCRASIQLAAIFTHMLGNALVTLAAVFSLALLQNIFNLAE